MELGHEKLSLGYEKLLGVYESQSKEALTFLSKSSLSLPEDPSSDLSALQKVIFSCQNYLGFLNKFMKEAIRIQTNLAILKNGVTSLLDDVRDEIVLRPDVQEMKPKAVQDAFVNQNSKVETDLVRKVRDLEDRILGYIRILSGDEAYARRSLRCLSLQVRVLGGQVNLGENRGTGFGDEGAHDF